MDVGNGDLWRQWFAICIENRLPWTWIYFKLGFENLTNGWIYMAERDEVRLNPQGLDPGKDRITLQGLGSTCKCDSDIAPGQTFFEPPREFTGEWQAEPHIERTYTFADPDGDIAAIRHRILGCSIILISSYINDTSGIYKMAKSKSPKTKRSRMPETILNINFSIQVIVWIVLNLVCNYVAYIEFEEIDVRDATWRECDSIGNCRLPIGFRNRSLGNLGTTSVRIPTKAGQWSSLGAHEYSSLMCLTGNNIQTNFL